MHQGWLICFFAFQMSERKNFVKGKDQWFKILSLVKVLSIRNTTFFTGTKTDPVNRRYKAGKLDTLKIGQINLRKRTRFRCDVTDSSSSHLLCVVYLLHHMLYGEYDVIDSSEIRGLLRKSTDSPGYLCKTGQFAVFEALYLRLTGSVFVPVKNVVFLMLRTLTRLSNSNLRSGPLIIFPGYKTLHQHRRRTKYYA